MVACVQNRHTVLWCCHRADVWLTMRYKNGMKYIYWGRVWLYIFGSIYMYGNRWICLKSIASPLMCDTSLCMCFCVYHLDGWPPLRYVCTLYVSAKWNIQRSIKWKGWLATGSDDSQSRFSAWIYNLIFRPNVSILLFCCYCQISPADVSAHTFIFYNFWAFFSVFSFLFSHYLSLFCSLFFLHLSTIWFFFWFYYQFCLPLWQNSFDFIYAYLFEYYDLIWAAFWFKSTKCGRIIIFSLRELSRFWFYWNECYLLWLNSNL